MIENSNTIIEDVIKETYLATKINKMENNTIINFLHNIDQLNVYTFFTEEASVSLMDKIKNDVDTQDIILDFINTILFKLRVLNIDINLLFNIIKDTTKIFTSSTDLDNEFKDQIIPDEKYMDGVIINMAYLIKIYGITTCLAIENGE
jgi:hypothetical protein